LSNFSHYKTWNHASNYVAKSYKDDTIPRERYFDDVRLQMDAKLWAEVYNKHNPPKKIDIMQMSILEFVNRPESPLFHLEHYIEGNYIKYNSNAGFVEDLHIRLTPHTFSHFTFEYSNHELIVVDIQGVGDLYTDPQIHTAKGTDYGDGNLGIKGFALFFYSHVCNDLCKKLGLSEFDLAPTELKSHTKIIDCIQKSSSCTKFKPFSNHSRPNNMDMIHNYSARTRYLLNRLSSSDENSNDLYDLDDMDNGNNHILLNNNINHSSSLSHSQSTQSYLHAHFASNSFMSQYSANTSVMDSPFDNEDAIKFLISGQHFKPRASGMVAERHHMLNSDTEFRRTTETFMNGDGAFESILGRIHLEMCKYHEFGRFLENEADPIDMDAAFFHLEHAAHLGITEAACNVSKIYMQFPHDILPDYKREENEQNFETGFEYMLEAAEKGEKTSLYNAAKAFDTGIGLPTK
jgi:elongation factor 2 kinase